MDVTVLIFSSTGASAILAIKSQLMQNTAPAKNVPGMITIGFDVPNAFLVKQILDHEISFLCIYFA